MSASILAQTWHEQYAHCTNDLESMRAWLALQPTAHDWVQWFDAMGEPKLHGSLSWGAPLFEALDQNEEFWETALEGAAQCNTYKRNLPLLLDYLRADPNTQERILRPLPLGCLEALASMMENAPPIWKNQLLVRTPDHWFGPANETDPLGIAPMHRLGVKLLCTNTLSAKQLPSLAWSPSALCDDYGRAPASLEPLLAPIQHALEYAIYMHETRQKTQPDALAQAEVHAYFERAGVHLATFETMLNLTHNAATQGATLANSIVVLQSMMAPSVGEYSTECIDDNPQP